MHMLEQHMGQDHVSAQDQADENMARLGSGVYLTKYKDKYPTVEMTSANQLTINPGSLLVNGRFCIIETPEILTVDNGSSGMTERDLVCVHWKEVEAEVQTASGDDTQTITKEEVDLVIVKGTPASSGATDPAISQDTIRSGVGEAWVPFARITKDGLTPSVAFIVDKMAPESEFRDSISPIFRIVDAINESIPAGVSTYQEVPTIDGYTAISATFIGTYTNGSRWIISNPFLATDVGITLVRMFNNNGVSSTPHGKIVVQYIKNSVVGIQ
jgi:hypothetical protein